MLRLKEKYQKEVIPRLKKDFGFDNDYAAPGVEAAVINIGTGKALGNEEFLKQMKENLARITGQWPAERKAKKAVSNFKVREGMVVGLQVTLRGARLYDFLEKFINVTLPRTRDFRGLPLNSFDKQGNYSVGFKECVAFPEIKVDQIEKIHGLGLTVITTAKSQKEGQALLATLGFPFSQEKKKKKKKSKRAFVSREQQKKEKKEEDEKTNE